MMTHVDDHVLAIPTVAEILWEAGDRAGATRLLEAVERVADPCGFAIARTDILRVRARLLACCAPAEAGDLFAQALCGAESIPCPQLQGRILRDWACASAQPQREERLQQALAIFQRLGAKPDAERTEMLLRQGSEPHVCGRSGGG